MSTLGAMARADEYIAATNAKQRQVSREAEDQKLPPRSTPVSLSAFTRNQQPSRNKGTKAWKPLSLDDIDDESDDQHYDATSVESPIEQTQSHTLLKCQPSAANQVTGVESDNATSNKIHIPQTATPIGPRVLIDPRDRGSFDLRTSAQKSQPHSAAGQLLPTSLPPSYNMGPSSRQPGLPYGVERLSTGSSFHFVGPQWVSLQPDRSLTRKKLGLDTLFMTTHGKPTTSLPANPPARSHMYPPGQKAMFESAQILHTQGNGVGTELGVEGTGMPQHTIQSIIHPVVPAQSTTVPFHEKSQNQQGSTSETANSPSSLQPTVTKLEPVLPLQQLRPRPGQNTFRHNNPAEMSGRTPIARTAYQEDLLAEMQEQMNIISDTKLWDPEVSGLSNRAIINDIRGHVDATHAPQNAANHMVPPQTHAQKSSDRVSVPWQVLQPTSAQKEAIAKVMPLPNLTSGQSESFAMAINNPAPGLQLPAPADLPTNDRVGMVEKLSELDGVTVGNEQWCRLEPPNIWDRARGQRLMLKASEDVGFHWPVQPLQGLKQKSDTSAVTKWFEGDKRGEQQVHEHVWTIAEQHANNLGDIDCEHTEAKAQGRTDAIRGLNVALGEVVMNVCGYFETIRSDGQREDEFSKWKPIPEFALERGGLLSGSRQNTSFFDDPDDCHHVAPTRIARDPRFRPQGYDGLRTMADEERKMRTDMLVRTV